MNQNRGMSNRFAVWLVAVLFGALGASGLVNLNFTPVDLVKSSKAIVCVEVGPYDESKAILPVKIIRALKGEAPKSLTIDLGDAGDQVMAEIKESIPAKETVRGLVFIGDASGARAGAARKPAGGLFAGIKWFALYGRDGKWSLGADAEALDLSAVWGGGNEMLEQVVDYVDKAASPEVPPKEGVSFVKNSRVGTVGRRVRGVTAVDLFGEGNLVLYVLSADRDRVLRCGNDGTWSDTTDSLAMNMSSRYVAFMRLQWRWTS